MIDIVEELKQIVDVRVVEDKTRPEVKPKQPKEVRTTYRTFTLSNATEPQQLLGHAPNRIQAVLQFTSAGPVVLGSSRSDVVAQNSNTAQINVAAAGIIVLKTTGDLWAQSTVAGNTNVGVIAEYEEN
jgi:hypothetical protein